MSKSVEIPITYAATNSITILNNTGIFFTNCDFSGIRIPNANLSMSFFSSANLSGADLSGVNFTSAYLGNCNLEKAVMKDVKFGIFPDF